MARATAIGFFGASSGQTAALEASLASRKSLARSVLTILVTWAGGIEIRLP